MSTVMGYEITVLDVLRNTEGVATRVEMRAIHENGFSRSYSATFLFQKEKLCKKGDTDIPHSVLAVMRRQAADILREKRGVARGPHEKNGSLARARQERASKDIIEEAARHNDGYKVD